MRTSGSFPTAVGLYLGFLLVMAVEIWMAVRQHGPMRPVWAVFAVLTGASAVSIVRKAAARRAQ